MTQKKLPEELKPLRVTEEGIICKGSCGKVLPATKEHFFFRKAKNGKYYPSTYCKPCEREKAKTNRKTLYATPDGKERILAQNLSYRQDPIVAASIREQKRRAYATDEEFRERRKELTRQWRRANPERKKQLGANWFQKNKVRLREEWNERYRTDFVFRLRNNLRAAIWEALRWAGGSKGGRSILSHLPYSMEDLKSHLESLWEPWMSWENYGTLDPLIRTWQIDHIVPQVLLPFDDFSHPNFLTCWALTNLRPLESSKNLEKGCCSASGCTVF